MPVGWTRGMRHLEIVRWLLQRWRMRKPRVHHRHAFEMAARPLDPE